MPDEPIPTYSETTEGERTIYTCLIRDAGSPEGICGHKTRDEGRMTEHMQQRHAGVMVKAPQVAPARSKDAAEPTPVPPTGTSARTPGSQEHPPHVSSPLPQPTTAAPQEEPSHG